MTLLVISPDYASHLFPLLALAEAWKRHGDHVVVATGAAVAPYVERAGFERVPLVLGRGSNAGTSRPEEQPVGEDVNLRRFFDATRAGAIATLRLQAELRRNDLLWEPVPVAQATLAVVRSVRPDAVLVDHLGFGATLGLQAAGIPYADVVLGHPTTLPVGGERYGVPPAWPGSFEPDRAELAGLMQLADEIARAFTDDWNAALQTLDPGRAPVADAFRIHGDVVLYNYPEALHDPGWTALLPTRHAFLGASPRDEELDEDAERWLRKDPGLPLVVVSFGSFLSARDDVLGRVVAALHTVDDDAGGIRVALATGSAEPSNLGSIPDGWLVRPFIPQVGLVRHAALAITHAGNNGVTEALAAGVPLLVLPFSTDQFAVAADLERAGLGLALDPNRATTDEIRAAALAVLHGSFQAAARALALDLQGDPGPDRAYRAVLPIDCRASSGTTAST